MCGVCTLSSQLRLQLTTLLQAVQSEQRTLCSLHQAGKVSLVHQGQLNTDGFIASGLQNQLSRISRRQISGQLLTGHNTACLKQVATCHTVDCCSTYIDRCLRLHQRQQNTGQLHEMTWAIVYSGATFDEQVIAIGMPWTAGMPVDSLVADQVKY